MPEIHKIHASLMSVDGKGVLLTGKSGSGKSDLLLRFIAGKNAVLVADDVVELQSYQGEIIGRAPLNLRGLLEVRGVGIVRCEYLSESRINLVVRLVQNADEIVRLPKIAHEMILGVEIPAIDLYAKEVSAPEKIMVKLNGNLLNPEE